MSTIGCNTMLRNVAELWLKIYIAASFIHSAAWGLYFAFTRFYIVNELGGGYTALLLLTGAEWGLPALSIIWGALADRCDRRRFVLLGATGACAFIISTYVTDPIPFVIVLSYASLAWGLAWPSVLAPILSSSESVGYRYGLFTIGSAIGWSIGSSAMGFIYNHLGPCGVLYSIALLYAASYLLYTLFFPRSYAQLQSAGTYSKAFLRIVMRILLLLIAIALTTFGIEVSFNVMAVKLRSEISEVFSHIDREANTILFGILYGGLTAILSIPARIIAGKIVDRWDPLWLFITVNVIYAMYIMGLALSHGVVTIILWQIPLYPFYDVSVYTATSRYASTELKAGIAGATLAAQSVGGLIVALVGPVIDVMGVGFAMFIAYLATIISAIICLIFIYLRSS
ncbi:MAG TPA: MFS transporter [Ignisphaera sp.]|nr:MFS transporter [Ignisphaera sp.]